MAPWHSFFTEGLISEKPGTMTPMFFHVHVDPPSYVASGPWKVSKAVGVGVLLQCSDLWMYVQREGYEGNVIRFIGHFDDCSVVTTTSCINITAQGDFVGYVKSFNATKLRLKNQLSMQASKQANKQSKRSEQEHARGKGKKARVHEAPAGERQGPITNYQLQLQQGTNCLQSKAHSHSGAEVLYELQYAD